MSKVWVFAIAAMLLGVAAFISALAAQSPISLAAWFVVPFAAASVASYVAPRVNFKVGMLTAIPSGILLFTASHIAGRLGLADALDGIGTAIAVVFSAPVIAACAAAGAFFGKHLSGGRNA